MRSLSTTLRRKVASRVQAGDNALHASLWVSRPTTPLTENRFLETQTILTSKNITKTSVVACHPNLMRGATDVYVGYLESGVVKVTKSQYTEELEKHKWKDTGFSQQADDFCLCFDGTMPKASNGMVEFKTETTPWVFWVLNSALYGKRIGDDEAIVIAETNCTKVSAVRAMWSESGDYDFGLVVFFILDGSIYYRQLIAGEWMDAEVVTFGPKNVVWSEIVAFRTWDYRIGIQGKTVDGTVYEMFTQFMGIGKQTTEHVDIRNVSVTDKFQRIEYTNVKNADEHVAIGNATIELPLGGLYPSAVPTISAVQNVEDENGDWGTTVVITFSNRLKISSVEGNHLQFTIVDSWGVMYYPNAVVANEDGVNVTLLFTNLNQAYGVCTLTYIPGTIQSMIDDKVAETSISFTPQNLKPIDLPKPEVELIWNE